MRKYHWRINCPDDYFICESKKTVSTFLLENTKAICLRSVSHTFEIGSGLECLQKRLLQQQHHLYRIKVHRLPSYRRVVSGRLKLMSLSIKTIATTLTTFI